MNLQNKTLLITGIDEFIGLRAAELAIAQGMKVRGIQTSQVKDQTAQKLGIEILVGNLTDSVFCVKACQGADIVLHNSQLAEEAGDIKHFREINVSGTVNIAKAAKQAGVKTFVHLSMLAVCLHRLVVVKCKDRQYHLVILQFDHYLRLFRHDKLYS